METFCPMLSILETLWPETFWAETFWADTVFFRYYLVRLALISQFTVHYQLNRHASVVFAWFQQKNDFIETNGKPRFQECSVFHF